MENIEKIDLDISKLSPDNLDGQEHILNYVRSAILKNNLEPFSCFELDDLVQEISLKIMNRNTRAILKQRHQGNESWKKMKVCYVSDTNVKQAYIDMKRHHSRGIRCDDHVIPESTILDDNEECSYFDVVEGKDLSSSMKFDKLEKIGLTKEEYRIIEKCGNGKSDTKNSIIVKLMKYIIEML